MTLLNIYGETFLRSMPQYKAYKQWFNEAPYGSKFIYHRGECLTETNVSYTLGKVVMQDALKGEVLLFQKRAAKYCSYPFEYIAVRTHKAPAHLIPSPIATLA